MASKYQKRHYEDVAIIIMDAWSRCDAVTGQEEHSNAILSFLGGDFANLFATDNPNFDRERFLKACGLESA